MKVEIKPTNPDEIEKLAENIEQRLDTETQMPEQETITTETKKTEKLDKIPGIQKYRKTNEEEWQPGLKGRPTQEQAYAKLENKEDAVKALIAIQEGYNLVILKTDKDWDLRQLKKYNPDMKRINTRQPPKQLDIEKTITPLEDKKHIKIEMPDEEETELIYQKMLT